MRRDSGIKIFYNDEDREIKIVIYGLDGSKEALKLSHELDEIITLHVMENYLEEQKKEIADEFVMKESKSIIDALFGIAVEISGKSRKEVSEEMRQDAIDRGEKNKEYLDLLAELGEEDTEGEVETESPTFDMVKIIGDLRVLLAEAYEENPPEDLVISDDPDIVNHMIDSHIRWLSNGEVLEEVTKLYKEGRI